MAKNKKENKNETLKKVIIFLLVIIVVSVGGYFLINKITGNDSNSSKEVTHVNLNEIEGYGITLNKDDTELYKTEFNKLKENLESKNIDYDEYAKSIAKLFAIDLYTMSNKTNKFDVGGIEFVLPSARDNYSVNVEDTLYKYLKDNSNGKRTQELPVVASIEVKSSDKTTFTIKSTNTEMEAYKVSLSWTYETKMGYDTTGEIIVVKEDNKLYVAEKN